VAILGGSTTWGFGLQAGQDFPAQLQRQLEQSKATSSIKVVNLGFNGEGAYSFKFTLKDYDYLDCDAFVLYSGYNDLSGPNLYVFRHRSPVFGWTGYLPLLPAFTVDKISVWTQRLTGQNKKVVFQPPDSGKNSTETIKQFSPTNDSNVSADWQLYCDRLPKLCGWPYRKAGGC
jgi:lysophospholipase L1-like esterase